MREFRKLEVGSKAAASYVAKKNKAPIKTGGALLASGKTNPSPIAKKKNIKLVKPKGSTK